MHAVYHELLTAIPEYSEIDIIARARDRDTVLDWNHLFDEHDDIHLHFVREPADEVDLWTQDLGEYFETNGQGRFLVSALPHRSMGTSRAVATSRESIAKRIFGPSAVISAKFVFEAGNLLFDRTESGLRVLAGEDVVTHSIESARLDGERLEARDVAREVSKQFGGAEVIVLEGDQGGGLFHIDQAFVILRDGKIILNMLPEMGTEEAVTLAGYREQLASLGYEVFELPANLDDIQHYRTSLNALPFTHRDSGRDMVIFPVFPGQVVADAPRELASQHLRGDAATAFSLFEHAGYEPLPVRDYAHISGGNTHCIANILY